MGHHTNIKMFCRICKSSNSLEKMTQSEEMYFFVSDFDGNRICSNCRSTFEVLIASGQRFTQSLHNFKIKGWIFEFNLIQTCLSGKFNLIQTCLSGNLN